MRKRKIFVSIISACIVLSLMAQRTFAAEQTVKVMTWNIGGWYAMPAEDRIVRMKKLASVINSHKIEIAYLQEFNDLAKTPDLEVLLTELRALGYPMYSDTQTYTGDGKKIEVMVLLSKYPLDKSTKQSIQIRGNRVAQSIIARDTPIGWVRLSNLHTHNTEPCNNFRSYLNFFIQFDPARSLIGGDTNLGLWEKPITRTRQGDSCAGIEWDQVNISCVDSANCLGNRRHEPSVIDWFFVFKQSDLYIQSSYNIGNVHGISDQHPAIVAVVGSKNIPTPPPVIPSPQSASNSFEGKPAIKVFIHNPGPASHINTYDARYDRWKQYADYWKSENIEVVGLQEQRYSGAEPPDVNILQKVLQDIGYPLFEQHLTIPNMEGNIILSRYPFKPNSYFTWRIKDNRYPQSVIITTPYGELRFVNIHTHGLEACKNSIDIVKPLLDSGNTLFSPSSESLLVGGDFNVALKTGTDDDIQIFPCERDNQFAIELTQNLSKWRNRCSANNKFDSTCVNNQKDAKYIDYFLIPKSSPLQLYSSWIAPAAIRNIADSNSQVHIPITALVGDPNWQFASASSKPGDLDNDGDVDVFDYNNLLGKFGTAGAPGYHAADIIKNGVVDIFDYNKLVEGFGK